MHKLLTLLLCLALLTGCAALKERFAAPTTVPTGAAAPTTPAATFALPSAAPTLPPAATATTRPSPAPTLTPSPTFDALRATLEAAPRRNPAAWRTWPVIPELTTAALGIYRSGLALGNNPRHFSKVADCQGIREVLMGIYDQPGFYKLAPENQALQETIDWFKGSFNRNGMATMGGFNARNILLAQFADPAGCLPGESPIACEYRVHRPSIALISLEFGYDGRTAAVYTAHLRKTIEFFIERGVLPILATKADNFEGDHSINQATAALAAEYDLPLWNWWRAAQDLPNRGLDITRPDGFHISVGAWNARSKTALQALNAIWRSVRSAAPAVAAATPTPRAGGTPTSTPAAADPPPSLTVAPGVALIGLARRDATGSPVALGVFRFDPAGMKYEQVLGPGWSLQDVAPDGSAILANRASDLYRIPLDGAPAEYLTDGFTAGAARSTANWSADGSSILFSGVIDGTWALYQYTPGNPGRLGPLTSGLAPVELYALPDTSHAYFLAGLCPEGGAQPAQCQPGGVLAATLARGGLATSASLIDLPGVLRPALSTVNEGFAYTYLSEKDASILAVTNLSRTKIWSPLPADSFALDYAWSPTGRWLAAAALERSDYSGLPQKLRLFLLYPESLRAEEKLAPTALGARLAWSAGGQYLLLVGSEVIQGFRGAPDSYRLALRLYDLTTGKTSDLDGKINPAGPDFIYVTGVEWISKGQ